MSMPMPPTRAGGGGLHIPPTTTRWPQPSPALQCITYKTSGVSLVIVNTMVADDDTISLGRDIVALLRSAQVKRLHIVSAVSVAYPLVSATLHHQGDTDTAPATLPALPSNSRLDDPLLTSLVHFAKVGGIPTEAWLLPSKRDRKLSPPNSQLVDAVVKITQFPPPPSVVWTPRRQLWDDITDATVGNESLYI